LSNSTRRHQKITKKKKLFIWISSEYTNFKQVEIANLLGISQPSVSKILKSKNEQISEAIEEVFVICGFGGI